MTVPAPTPSERHLFELWCNVPGAVAIPLLPGTAIYANRSLQRSWGAWQARAALSAPLAPRLLPPRDDGCGADLAARSMVNGLQWISVEDRLPEQPTPVLAVIIGQRRKAPRVGMATHWRLGKGYSGTDPEWMEGGNAFIGAHVTHWMPLALPPAPGVVRRPIE